MSLSSTQFLLLLRHSQPWALFILEKWVLLQHTCPPHSQRQGPQEHHPLFWRFGTLGSWVAWKQHSWGLAFFPPVTLASGLWGGFSQGSLPRPKAAALQVRLWSLALLELQLQLCGSPDCIPLPRTCWPASCHTSDLPLCWGLACCWWDCLSLTAITRPESLTYVFLRPIPLLLTCHQSGLCWFHIQARPACLAQILWDEALASEVPALPLFSLSVLWHLDPCSLGSIRPLLAPDARVLWQIQEKITSTESDPWCIWMKYCLLEGLVLSSKVRAALQEQGPGVMKRENGLLIFITGVWVKCYKSANLHLLSGKVMKQTVWQSVCKQLNNSKVMNSRRSAFVHNNVKLI